MSCDCQKDEKPPETCREIKRPETITLFEKCPKPLGPGRDFDQFAMCDMSGDHDQDSWKDIQYIRPLIPEDVCITCAKKSSSASACSSSSSRMYKFVTPRECECMGEVEGEGEEEPELPSISFEPCAMAEEEIEEEPDIECTLAIIKPEAMMYRKEIEQRVFEEGFEICHIRWLQLTHEQASEFYSDNYGQLNFAHLVAYMASGPIIIMVLAKHRAVEDWRFVIGPTKVTEARLYYPDSIRGKYGRRGEDFKNAVHGSVSRELAEREIHFFFPEFILEPLLRSEGASNYLWDVITPMLVEGLAMCCKHKPADPLLWLAHWLILNNPHKPKLPENLALLPT